MKEFMVKHKVLTTVVCISLAALAVSGILMGVQAVFDSPKNEVRRLFEFDLPEGCRTVWHRTHGGYLDDGLLKHIYYDLEIEIPPEKYPEIEAGINEFFSRDGRSPYDETDDTEEYDHYYMDRLPNGVPACFAESPSDPESMEVVRTFCMGVYESLVYMTKTAISRCVTVARDPAGNYHLFVTTF